MQAVFSVLWNLSLAFVIAAGGWLFLEAGLSRVIAAAFGVAYFLFASFYDELRRVRRKVIRERLDARRRQEVATSFASSEQQRALQDQA